MAIITLADLKTYLGVSDTRDDAVLTRAVNSANRWVVDYCGRSFDTTPSNAPTARVFRASQSEGRHVNVDDFWSTTGLIVQTDDNADGTFETTWTINTDFYLEPLNGQLYGDPWPYMQLVGLTKPFSWAYPYGGNPSGYQSVGNPLYGGLYGNRPIVQVTAAWGWATVPDPVSLATLMKAHQLFARKNSPEGVLGGFADFSAIRLSSREDRDIVGQLDPYVHPNKTVSVG